jgi:hypothetical protein
MNIDRSKIAIRHNRTAHFAELVIPVVKSLCIYVARFVWQPHSRIYFSATRFNFKYSFSEAQFIIFEFHKKKIGKFMTS